MPYPASPPLAPAGRKIDSMPDEQISRSEPSFPDRTFTIEADGEGTRLDIFLGGRCPERSRSHFKKMIREGRVLVDGRTVKPGYEVRSGDRVEVWMAGVEALESLVPQPMPLDILYEDDELVVVNKPPGLVVHPGAGHEEGTLVHGLLAHCPRLAIQGAPLRPGIVHRLDRNTSGAMVIAKSDRAYLDLIHQFKEHCVHKEYLALVYGLMPERCGEIRTLIDRHPVDRKRMAVVEGRGREAISCWQVAEEWGGEISLLLVRIETGRTHQIRVHFSHLQHPVVGDATYGGGPRRARSLKSRTLQDLFTPAERQMLHAWRLDIDLLVTGARLAFTLPPPSDFTQLIESLRDIFRLDSRLSDSLAPFL